MTKETGLGWTTFTIEDVVPTARDLRRDTTNFELSTPRGVQDVTGIDKSAMERLLLLADASITINGVFDDEAAHGHIVYRNIPASTNVSRQVISVVSGQTMTVELLLTDYALTRADDGALTYTVPGVLADGVAPAWT